MVRRKRSRRNCCLLVHANLHNVDSIPSNVTEFSAETSENFLRRFRGAFTEPSDSRRPWPRTFSRGPWPRVFLRSFFSGPFCEAFLRSFQRRVSLQIFAEALATIFSQSLGRETLPRGFFHGAMAALTSASDFDFGIE